MIAIVITSTSSTATVTITINATTSMTTTNTRRFCHYVLPSSSKTSFCLPVRTVFKSWVCRPSLHLPCYLVSSLSAANMCRCSAPVISHHYLAFLVALSCPLILKNV
jgi:hypothetical protein